MSFKSRAQAGIRRMINRLTGQVTIAGAVVRCGVMDNASGDILLAEGGGDVESGNIALCVMKQDVVGLQFNSDSTVLYRATSAAAWEEKLIKTIGGLDDPDNPSLTLLIGDEEAPDHD